MAATHDYLAKAQENLAGAESELHKGDYRMTHVSQREVQQAVRSAQTFVHVVTTHLQREESSS